MRMGQRPHSTEHILVNNNIVTRLLCCIRYLLLALSQRNAEVEHFGSESTATVQIRQNSPPCKVTVLEVYENELPPLVPLHT